MNVGRYLRGEDRHVGTARTTNCQPTDAVPVTPVAWMRRWYFDGEEPAKVKRENGRMAWPYKFKLLPVTPHKCLEDDVPLYSNETRKQ